MMTKTSVIQKIREAFGCAAQWIFTHPLFQCFLIAWGINLVIEMLGRKSILSGLSYMILKPHFFLCGLLIIMFTLTPGLLMRRRRFYFTLVSTIWLLFGTVNGIVLIYAITPLVAMNLKIDIALLNLALDYINVPIVLGVLLALALIVFILIKVWRTSPKHTVKHMRASIAISAVTAIAFIYSILFGHFFVTSEQFGSLAEAYKQYGFAYSFIRTAIDRGVDRPESYSEKEVDEILDELETHETNVISDSPNIIFLQLESFFDVSILDGVSCSEDPTPTFNRLKNICSSGRLSVPSLGGGTANTEFEVLTGMNLSHFGAGEFPYDTVLQDELCETINFNLKELGYSTHAIHNYTATFYDRHEIFSRLGFDTFTSIEYMSDVTYSPTGWAQDTVLTDEIMTALKSTEKQDLVYTISVQGHGKYPEESIDYEPKIQVTGIEGSEENGFEYYVNQINGSDTFIAELIEKLENYDEDVVVVIFGDHLPAFDFETELLTEEELYSTEYVIWSNSPLEKHDRDLETYQLSAYVLEQLGINNGIITKFHQNYTDEKNYQEALEMLEYDILYGERTVYNGQVPFEETEMTMGIKKIAITQAEQRNSGTILRGQNFTASSVALINGEKSETIFLYPHLIFTDALNNGDVISVAQIAEDGTILSSTESFTFIDGTLTISN